MRPGRAAVGMFSGGSLLEELRALFEEELVDDGFVSAFAIHFVSSFS